MKPEATTGSGWRKFSTGRETKIMFQPVVSLAIIVLRAGSKNCAP